MSRQFILTKGSPAKFDMIIDEVALRRVTGNHKVMAHQLRAILDKAELPNVRLWVVPSGVGGNAGFLFPFYLMDFHRSQSVVLLESQSSAVFLEDQTKIDYFRGLAAKLAKVALDPAKIYGACCDHRKTAREGVADERSGLAEVEL